MSEQFDAAGSVAQRNGADKRRLAKANPTSWPLHATTMMMDDHLKLTTQEAVDELGGHWAKSVADYDRVENEILMMSKTLADGIVKQFPTRFAVQ